MVRRILVGAVALVALLAAPAAAQYVPFVVTPRNVVPGGEVTASGQGCKPGTTVAVYLVRGNQVKGGNTPRPPATTTPVGTTVSDGSGNFTLTFRIPLSTKPGIYTVIAVCDRPEAAPVTDRRAGPRAEGAQVLGETITVLGPTVAPTTPGTVPDPGVGGSGSGSGSGSLPRTGSDLDGLGLAGVALLVVGGLVLLATRRRGADAPTTA